MSKSKAEHEESDENVLFDDGFSVVDDINTAAGSVEGDQKANGKSPEDSVDPDVNSKEIVSDGRKEENSSNKKGDVDAKIVECNKQKEKEVKKDIIDKQVEVKKEPSKSCGDGSTLILSNDEDLGSETPVSDQSKVKVEKVTKEAKVSNPQETKGQSQTKEKDANLANKKPPIRKKGTSSSFVWINNISNSVNASSLKKHFSDCGRVNTAKVVTNGRLFFGYVEFDSPKIAQECVEKMNNTVLSGKKILVSRNRPDVTRKSSNVQKKSVKNDQQASKGSDQVHQKNGVDADVEKKEAEKSSDKTKNDNKKKNEEEKKPLEEKKKVDETDKKNKPEDKQVDKKSRSTKDELSTKSDELKMRMNETKKKLETLREDLDRTQVETRNLRRRLTTEQKKCKAEEMRAERYRQQMRKLGDEIKEAKLEFKKDVHRLTKKHKMEMEKAELDRDSLLKREDDLRRRQEEINREFKKLEEAKKSFEHLKRTRKSRSMSPPPMKRFRGREGVYPDVSPPPPPKLSGDIRKPLLDRPPTYYEEKKSRAIYERLGDYADKPFSKDSSNGRYRSSYPGESSSGLKNSWSQLPSESWKKSTNPNSNFLKPYMERFGGEAYHSQSSSSSYYPPGTSDYPPKHFESSRKY